MDLSKLPKFSQTPPPPAENGAPLADAPANPAAGAQGGQAGKVELFCRCGAPITPGTNFCSHCGANYYEAVGGRARPRDGGEFAAGGMWIEAFVSIGIGIFLLLFVPATIKYYGHQWFGLNTYPSFDPIENHPSDYVVYTDGTRKMYRDVPNYWSDLAVTAFAIVLILEGIVFAIIRNRWIILGTAVLTLAVTAGNLVYVVSTYSSMGLAPISALAVIIGVMMAGYQVMMFKELSAGRRSR
jgi:hypothetical protein